MSLMRQLWLTVVVSTVIAFAGSLLVSMWSAQGYLAQQLERKNADVANSLALSMTQQSKDPVTIELQVAALFDTGFYQQVSVADPFGKVTVQRVQDKSDTKVPAWFIKSFPIGSRPGLAQVSDGWKQYGTVTVISHSHFAYQALWEQAGRLLLWFCLGGGAVGLAGMAVLRAISRSLNDVVDQAGAIGERRFIKIAEPRTPELRAVAHAMNSMVGRVGHMYTDSAARLDALLRRVNYDQLTGLPNRDYFMAHLKEQISGGEAAPGGVLAVMRLADLKEINGAVGRVRADELLGKTGQVFADLARPCEGALPGRIKAGDIALVLPGEQDAQAVCQRMQEALSAQLAASFPELTDIYHLGVVRFERGSSAGDVLSRGDHALALAEGKGANASHAVQGGAAASSLSGEQWRILLSRAVSEGNATLVFFPVARPGGGVLHREGMVRMQLEAGKPPMTAGEFMPVAAHLKLTAQIDLEVVRLALQHAAEVDGDVAVNLCAETIGDWAFRTDLSRLLKGQPESCPRLWFEVSEYGAFKHFDAFRDLCLTLKAFGCRIGIEQFGLRLPESQKLTELGLDYIKIHPGLAQGINENAGNQEFLNRFCGIAHAVGVIVIATGVVNEAEASTLKSIGVDGVSGPAVAK